MSTESRNLVKEILIRMNTGKFDLDNFYETIEKETGGKLTFTNFKYYLDKHYENISKSDRILLLKQISLEQTGLIDLTDLFNSFSKTINEHLYSPILAFYNISRKIEKNLKQSSLEFIYKNSLTLDQELNINEFYTYVSQPLNLDDTTSKNVFKCLDYNQKGKIQVADFILVVDSYRQDYVENYLKLGKNNLKNEEEEKKENFLTAKNQNGESHESLNGEGMIGIEIPNKFNLNDLQLYWITRFLQVIEPVGLTAYMVFSLAANEKNLREMFLENLKKKLKVVIPSSKITAAEITHICEAFDVNKNGVLNFDDYTEILEICKIDPIFSSSINDHFNADAARRSPKKDEILLQKLKQKRIRNIHMLPVRGNFRVLSQLKGMLYSRANPNKSQVNNVTKKQNNSEENKDQTSGGIGDEVRDKINNANSKNYNKLETYNSYTIAENEIDDEVDKILNSEGNDSDNFYLNKTNNININNVINNNTNDKNKSLINHNFIKNFIRELEVFENGEWYFIDILEEIKIEKQVIPVFSLFNTLNTKLCPSITKKTTFAITKQIDEDSDGLISYSNLIQFLLSNLNHTSVKLALKEMARVLEQEASETSTSDYFKRSYVKEFDELNSVNFVRIILKMFNNLPNLVVKKLYYELKQLEKKDSITAKILIDLINEYREKVYFSSFSAKIANKNKGNYLSEEFEKDAKLLSASFNNNKFSNSKNNTNSLASAYADKSLFDSEMKKLVRHLQKCFACFKVDFYNQNKIQSSLFKENLIKFLDLPLKFNLKQYRENFINSLYVNLSLGITLFNEIKNMQNNFANLGNSINSLNKTFNDHKKKNLNLNINNSKNEKFNNTFNSSNSTISRDDLINFITSYYDPVISRFDTETVVSLIEKNFSPIKYCFESIDYNPNGLVILELIKIFGRYYPRIPKHVLIEILKLIDAEKKGLLQYKNINMFIIKFSKNFKFSTDLFFKELAALIDKTNLPTFDFFANKAAFANLNQINDKVEYFEHNAFFFETLKFNFELSDFIFVYLSEKKFDGQNNFIKNLKDDFHNTNNTNDLNNSNCEEEGYSFDKLAKNIDFYRAKIPGNKLILNKTTHKIIDNSNQINKIYQDFDKLQSFFNCLNEIKSVGEVLNDLFISENLQVAIFEIFRLLQKNYSNKIAKETLMKFTKLLDSDKKGLLPYESFYRIIKDNSLVDVSLISDLHVRFIANSACKQFKSSFESFLNFKNLTKNNFLSYEEFKGKFGQEFYKNEALMITVFNKLREGKGKWADCINMQVFVDFLKYQLTAPRHSTIYLNSENNINDNNNKNKNENNDDQNSTEAETEKLIYNLISKCDEDFIQVFLENTDLKEASVLGKISSEGFTKILTQHFPNNFLSADIKNFFNCFNTIDKKFNLLKFLEWFETKFSLFSPDEIIRKARENIPNNVSNKLFFQRMNLKSFQSLSLFEFVSYSTAVFKLTKYEAAYAFAFLLNSDKNPTSNEFKCSFDLFLNEFKIESLFKNENENLKSFDNSNNIGNNIKEKKLDKFVILTLFKFCNFLETLKSKLDLFKSFDADGDGVLTRTEFEKLLVKCTLYGVSLNDMQITSIINLADKNGDGVINYIEFIEFLNQVQNNFSKENENLIDVYLNLNSNNKEKIDLNIDIKDFSNISAIKNITTKYDTAKLKENYEFNLKNFSAFEMQKTSSQRVIVEKGKGTLSVSENSSEKREKILKLTIFYLQEEFIENLNKFLYETSLLENFGTDVVEFKKLWEMLKQKEKLRDFLSDDETKEKLLNFSMENLQASQKNKILLEKGIHIKNLINNVIKFKIFAGSSGDENAGKNKLKESVNSFVFNSNAEMGDMHVNNIKESIMNCMATKKRSNKKVLARNIPYDANANVNEGNFKDEFSNNARQIENSIKNTKIRGAGNYNDKNTDNQKGKKPNVNSKSEQIRDQMKKDRSEAAKNSKFTPNIKADLKNKKPNNNNNNYDDYEENEDYYVNYNYENETETPAFTSKLKTSKNSGDKNSNSFSTNFKDIASNLTSKEYNYTIIPEQDYFRRPDGRLVETILNSEEAAIKKCELIANSLKNAEVFFDTEFGSQRNDVGRLNKFSLYAIGVQPRGAFAPEQIEWYRMEEICPDQDPLFINDGADSNDVIQGSLGDCWFISALSVLATKDHLLRGEFNETILEDGIIDEEENLMLSTGVYPPILHSFRLKKIFCFKFFKDFQWRWVIIDDRLPCRKTTANQIPRLIYARCKSENEFWVPLIEKAYAKLHGNYESLISGFVDEGLVDLTGFTARKINITLDSVKTPAKADEMWNLIKEYSCVEYNKEVTKTDRHGKAVKSNILRVNNTMMGVSIDGKGVEMDVIYNNQKCGLLARHAYSVLDTFEISKPGSFKARKKSRLLRIRNPWGTKEWKGKWCDESQEVEMNKELIMEALNERYKNTDEKIELEEEDGTFLMSFKDFRKIFTNIYVCIDFPDSYIGIRFFDAWTKSESGGLPINNTEKERKAFAKNPQYYINTKQKTNLQITLLQNDGRLTPSKFPYAEYIRKNCLVLTPVKSKTKLETFENTNDVEITPVKCYRENTIVKVLQPGQYILSACCLNEGEVGTFCLQFNFEDSFVDNDINDINFIRKLKNVQIERLDDIDKRVKYELIKEGTVDEIKAVSKKKCEFLFNNFGKMIKNNDQNVYGEKKPKKKNDELDEDNI